jgi:hypothetical protein
MTGIDFERYVAALLKTQGYQSRITKGSGDFGVDIVAEKDGIKYAVQVKRHRGKVSRHAISDAVAGKSMYKCDSSMVITNSFFTEDAKKLAKSADCLLIDRGELANWIVNLQEKDKENIPAKNLGLAKKKELPIEWIVICVVGLFGILLSGILLYLNTQTPQVERKPASTAVATSNKYAQQEKKGQSTHVVYPGERVGNFVLGMTKEQVMKLGKPHFRYNISDRVENWTYQNKKTGNMLSATFSDSILTSVCFTSDKFDTVEGITTANFDKPHEELISNPSKIDDALMRQVGASPKMSLLQARYNYRTGGLFYTLDSEGQRQGCIFKQ